MKIMILGVGALGSNIAELLASDLRGEHTLAIVDKDQVEERNIRAGTQFYNSDTIEMNKVDALEYMIYKMRNRIVIPLKQDIEGYQWEVEVQNGYDLLVDCLDNQRARKIVQEVARHYKIECLHLGFSERMTFDMCWDEHYIVPTDITGFDVCEAQGAASFIKMVSALGGQVVQEFVKTRKKREFLGNRFMIKEVG